MRELKKYILIKNEEFARRPIMAFLADSSIDPRRRLFIAPCMAHFAMSFGDLNKYVYRDMTKGEDIFQRIINEHTTEDDHHFQWFLTDLERLGFDRLLRFTDALRFLWSEETVSTRRLSYELSACLLHASPFERYIVLKVVEASGNVMFTATVKAAGDLHRATGQECIFYGEHHLAMETGHAVGEAAQKLEEVVDAYQLSDEQRSRAITLVDWTYAIFTDHVDELHRFVVKHAPPPAPELPGGPESRPSSRRYMNGW